MKTTKKFTEKEIHCLIWLALNHQRFNEKTEIKDSFESILFDKLLSLQKQIKK